MSEIPTLEDGAVCWVHIGDTHLVDRDAPRFSRPRGDRARSSGAFL